MVAGEAARAEALAFIDRHNGDLMDVLHAVAGSRVQAEEAETLGESVRAFHLRVYSAELLDYATGVARYLRPDAVKAATDEAIARGRI